MKRCLRTVVMGITALTMAITASASTLNKEEWPQKPIRIIVPFTTGGSVDIMMRALGMKLSQSLKQSVIIENRPGAGGAIGTTLVANAKPDGYTLAAGTTGTHVVNPLVLKDLSYDSVRDFEPISLVQTVPLVLAINPQLNVVTFAEFIELAKNRSPDAPITIAAPSNAHHITIAHLAEVTGASFQIVPYSGPAQSVTDAIGGHIDAVLDTGMAVAPHDKSGDLKILAVGSLERLPFLKNTQTISEMGYPGFEAIGINSLYAPAGTAPEVIQRLNKEIKEIMGSPDIIELVNNSAGLVVSSSPDELAAWQHKQTKVWKELIEKTQIQFFN
ncbi:Bug family tripartite tricarboxylate transporter substrate binding protein [Alcaligenes endophyticus]|uniref:Tripartite tricarboxylate transporter substrate binding protein n=1 Tax=Alcaligenes endophyticus TaxID=1929088 RepID=A0ABT8EF12_9BURK|nr:tripartite tricarboxylate transporter substrate binding protein [Alcaligenes endophyticus]MCX5590460.1 tripartite tricarboxylate transporter substrate binding protein [Alcaligenes endophyticus]MDN4119876.1 tripartite tricarboxylate transporter substrate binding protein [Alcaligenes endophyticus]